MLKKELTRQEVINIFHKHSTQSYFEPMAKFLMNGECMILMLIKDNCDPILEFKKLIGPSDPVEAKVQKLLKKVK